MFRGPKSVSDKDPSVAKELEIALENRSFEIQLFWQRSNYFLVLMTALGIGAFSVEDEILSPLVSFVAFMCSILWFRTNLGSKFWQEFWESEVASLAGELGIRSFIKGTGEAVSQVKSSLERGNSLTSISIFHKWVDRKILEKPSVTYHMILLSLFSAIIWLVVTLVFLARLLSSICAARGGCQVCLAFT